MQDRRLHPHRRPRAPRRHEHMFAHGRAHGERLRLPARGTATVHGRRGMRTPRYWPVAPGRHRAPCPPDRATLGVVGLGRSRGRNMTQSQDAAPVGTSSGGSGKVRRPQEYYDEIKAQVRRGARPAPGLPARGHGAVHLRPHRRARELRDRPLRRTSSTPREPINDTVEVLFIGGGFSALLTVGPPARARRREHPHRRARRRRRRHLVLEPLSRASPATWSPTTTCRCSTRWATCRRGTTPRARRSSPTARPSPAATTSTTWPCSRRR